MLRVRPRRRRRHAGGIPPPAAAERSGAVRGPTGDPRRVLQAGARVQLRANAGASGGRARPATCLLAADIDKVTVRVTKAAALIPAATRAAVRAHPASQDEHSLQRRGGAYPRRLRRAQLRAAAKSRRPALASRIDLTIDPGFSRAFPAKQGAAVIVRTRDGKTFAQSADNVEPTDPDGVHDGSSLRPARGSATSGLSSSMH